MKSAAIALAVSFAVVSPVAASHAGAEPVTLTRSTVKDGLARLHRYCDQRGRCWTEGYRNLLLETYATAPPPLYGKIGQPAAKQASARPGTVAAPAHLRNAQARMR